MTALSNYLSRRPDSRDLATRFDTIFGNLWEEFDRKLRLNMKDFDFSFAKSGYPRIDIIDSSERMTIEASVPGLTKDQVSVEYADNILTLSGASQNTRDEKTDNRVYRELHRSQFSRSMTLDSTLYDVDKIEAEVKNGLLTVTVPKLTPTEEKVKKIEIRG